MAANPISTSSQGPCAAGVYRAEQASAGAYITLVGRILFSTIFIVTGIFHFSAADIAYAAQAGVPMPGFLVPASGILAMIGGLSILLGYKAKIGAWLVVIFLIPVTLKMHNFWAVTDPMMQQMQMAMFLKNVTMIGGALLISQFGSGPLSLDGRKTR
jgi:putative oxidoreductase